MTLSDGGHGWSIRIQRQIPQAFKEEKEKSKSLPIR